jgi:hypothetical protein
MRSEQCLCGSEPYDTRFTRAKRGSERGALVRAQIDERRCVLRGVGEERSGGSLSLGMGKMGVNAVWR